MKYSASIFIRTNSETHERFTDEENIYNYFKELFGKKRSRVIEESFSAPDMLSKLSAAFKDSGINNLVRLTHDETDFFLDTENKPNDLDATILKFKNVLQDSFERFYEEISVVMESEQFGIDFVIELLLLRVHPVGEYPIQIKFLGLPQSTENIDIEIDFKLFVNKVEQNITKFLSVSDLTVSYTKKSSGQNMEIGADTAVTEQDEVEEQTKECRFFPLYGVTLGKTTVKKLAALGVRSKGLDSDNKPYKFYRVRDMNFWFEEQTATHMYLTYTSSLPKIWRNCGFDWVLSYNEWVTLFKRLGFSISDIKLPEIGRYE